MTKNIFVREGALKANLKGCRNVLLGASLALMGFTFQSCSDDDTSYPTVDGQAPVIALATDHIQAEPGSSFTIKGKITDADGIKSIKLKNSGMLLDKTIDLLTYYPDTLLHEYNLAYAYTASDEWDDNSSFPLEITVEDVVGHTSTATLTVTGDGDNSAPVFLSAPSSSLTVLVQNPKLTLNATISDNKALESLVVACPDLNISDSLTLGGVKEYSFSKVYELSATEKDSLLLSLRAYDKLGNVATTQSYVSVSELPDFAKMYLADVATAAELTSDLYGVPMLIDHVGEYQYQAHYYNQKAGTEIRFVPQKTDFEPICFGVDENTGLLTSNPSEGQPIVLDQVGYYEIDFNTVTGEYDVHSWTPTTAAMTLDGTTTVNFNDGSGDQPAQICLAGSGLPGAGSWTTNQNNEDGCFILKQSTVNPYLLYQTMELTKGTKISFTISQTHWWGWWPEPFWRFDGSAENEANKLNGGDNMKEVEVITSGTYLFEFDYALLRSRITLVK